MSLSRADLAAKLLAQGRITPAMLKPREVVNKYHAQPTADSTGRVHPSKLQARITDRLRGEYLTVIPEVSIPLSDRQRDRIRIDAMAIIKVNDDGSFVGRMIEIKGKDLGEGKQKRRRFEDEYGIPIEVLKKD